MIFSNKTIFLFVFCSIALSSAYALVAASQHIGSEAQPATVVAAPVDTNQETKPHFQVKKFTQNNYEELNTKYPMDAPKPDNVKSTIEYDAQSGNYVFKTSVGNTEIATPFLMTGQEYQKYSALREMQNYWKEKNSKAAVNNEDKYAKSDMKFNIGAADKVFGPGGVQIKTQGSAELIFGFKKNKVDNPALTQQMRTSNIFDFQEKIQMNVAGSVGDKVNFGLNYNTESSFDFDQKMVKLGYKGKDDDIIKSIEAGNVSMPLNSSLITGSTALFGIKTQLQFGRLNVTAIASQQESQTQTVSSKGGLQTTKFDIPIDNYDDNRHFFLAHYFRSNFEKNMSKLPYVSSGITINRMEVWVTNKRGNYDQARNIVAFMDLAETDSIDNHHWTALSADKLPQNKANTLYEGITGIPGIRDIQQTNSLLGAQGISGFTGGEDYEKIESARKLDASEYTFSPSLGFISLKTALNPDEVLGVAYEYTFGGNVYQVGEFSTDAVTAPQALVIKLLKSTTQSPQLKSWKLMMKNVYDLGALQLQPDNFKLNIVYRNDSVGTELQYLSEGNIKNKILLRVMNLDRLDTKNAPNPDGKFDYVEGFTVQSATGRIIFPVLEPFGSHLKKAIGNDAIAQKYIYPELYDSTLVVAQQFSERNKFRLVGAYKGSSGSEIKLNAMNIPRGSVTVTAGGTLLVENTDYTVDYTMGTVTILNKSLIASGTNVDVKLENQSTFSMQRKTLLGTHMEYQFNKDFSVGGTIMHLSETPLTTKVNTGNEPISNTIWGANTSWRKESQLLTNMLNVLPFVNATKPSTIALNAEFAQLIPGHSGVISSAGLAYIDDFESTKTSIDIHYPTGWYLASTPYNPDPKSALFPEAALSNNINYGKNRALFSWFYVDPIFNNSSTSLNPDYIRNNDAMQSNNLTRDVLEQEIFPYKQTLATQSSRMTVLNLSFYPTERGPYNLDVAGMNTDGTLANPTKRWGGIMRKLDATDFETSNIEYIEFWMMDPYVKDGLDATKKGDLYFNLGDVSEDILKDGKKFFENGMPADGDPTKTETTTWGRVPKTQSTVNAFDNTPGARKNQDIGLDGLSTTDEFIFPTYKDYVDAVKAKVTPDERAKMEADPFSPLNDPAGDNYHFYRGSDYDKQQLDIMTRYKHFNGPEGNSPDATNVTESYATSATSIPDGEDINNDNTMNEYEKYYQYHVRINKDQMEIGKNYITDKITADVDLKNGKQQVTWYQFKIPVRQYDEKIGSIRNFKSIRFIRMFMTNFDSEAHLRLGTLDLVRGEWRTYTNPLYNSISATTSTGTLDVQAVNIEENGNRSPINYVLPPGVTRETDPGQPQLLQQNEQSMVLRVNNLAPGDARGVYKNTSYDMRQYKRLQMFVHAEKLTDDSYNLKDNELTCFVRIGSDMVNNYYEYEIPLRLTPFNDHYSGNKLSDQQTVWYPENMFDFSFDVFTNTKLKRNKAKQSGTANVSNLIPYVIYDPNKPLNKVTVVGNPSISDVENIMIGVRNGSNSTKSGEIWVNEMRMSEFDESGGWAGMANLAVGLSDVGTMNVSGRIETAGYGGIESNVTNRRLDDLHQLNFSTSLELGRFLPEKARLKIPAYFSYSNETVSPKYNPLDQDVLLSDALNNLDTKSAKDSLKQMSQTVNTSKSFNITGAKVNIKSKTPKFYDPANVTFSYAYTESNQHSSEVEQNLVKDQKGSVDYSFSFNPHPVEPFKNVKILNSPILKIIKDFNFNYLPTSLSMSSNMDRQYSQIKLRDLSATSTGTSGSNLDLSSSRDFMWNRQFDLKWDLTKSIKLGLQTAMNASIIEPYYTPEIGKQYYESWRDSVWSNIKKLGVPYSYQQVFNASWRLPIDKLPLLDWVNGNASYNSNYSWNRTAKIEGETQLGNIATSMGAWQLDGQFNLETLYNKSKYLKDVNRRFGSQSSLGRPKFQSRTYTQEVNLEKNKLITVNHRLGSEKFKFTAVDKTGKPVTLNYKIKNATTIEITPTIKKDSILLTLVSLDPNIQSDAKSTVDFVARTLMMVRRVSFTYRTSNSMVLPGFKYQPNFLGQQSVDGVLAPGYGFVFGFVDANTIKNINKDWLVKNDSVVTPATNAFTSDLDIKASVEPIPGFKIDLNAKRYQAKNTSTQYMFPDMPQTYTGSYNITVIALSTAFKPMGTAKNNYSSVLFDNFLANRQIIADRLNGKLAGTRYPNSGFLKTNGLGDSNYNSSMGAYGLNSTDVLIPAFLAAYTGRNVNTVNTDPFLSLLSVLPNWRVSYDGLSNIPWIKDHFKSVSLTHAYTCKYSIGSYTSYSTWVGLDGDNSALGYIRDVQNDNYAIPSSPYNISDVSLTEQFSPLIGVNVAMKNSVTGKVEYRKQRNMVLNLSSTQLIESGTSEYVVGLGYILKDFDVILRLKSDKQTKVKNDLKISADVSYKDIKTLLRKVEENITQASNGNKLFTLKVMADYVFSSKLNIQLFYDRQSSTPLISSSYPVSSTNFGVSFKFMLTR
jgi:cell surface protein SprA